MGSTLDKSLNRFLLFLGYALVPLFLGLCIYIFFGSTDSILIGFISDLVGSVVLENFTFDFPYLGFVKNHVADGLWSFSLTSTLCLLFYKEFALHKILFVAFLVSASYELSQFFGLIGGTGDVLDVVVMYAFSLLSYYQIKNKLSL